MKQILSCLTIVLFLSACGVKEKEVALSDRNTNKEETLQKFKDAKFGLFIHWGLYAIPAGVWKGEEIPWLGEHIMRLAEIPVMDYEKLATEFNPVNFNADEYAKLAKDAGMKYLVITSKHHDGFAMFESDADEYNMVDATPFKRDVIKELALACKKIDMPFGLYYSQAQDWHHPQGVANTWDYPAKTSFEEYEPYINGKSIPQINEISTKYGPLFLMWFDTPRGFSEEQARNLATTAIKNQPGILVTDRVGFNLGTYGQMGDNAIPTQVKADRYWETPATLNDTWGFKKNDTNWKNPRDLIFKLTDIVSKGGNYLLNIGPDATGAIPQASVNILTTMGKWLDINGEAIYETTHSPFYVDNIDWRCTQKPNTLYFHIIQWSDKVVIEGLRSKVLEATFLETGEKVEFVQEENKLIFSLPANPIDEYNSVIKVKVEDKTPRLAEGYDYKAQRDTVFLHSLEARYRGEGTYYDWESNSATDLHARLFWFIQNVKSGTYSAKIVYACEDEEAGSEIVFMPTNTYLLHKEYSATKQHIQATNGDFKTFDLPDVEITEETKMIAFALDDEKSVKAKMSHIVLIKK
jgi:alpha-L-fucosidase